MAIIVISRPATWNAIKNPTVYKLGRRDNTISALNDSGGFAQVQINGTDLTAYYQVGNTISLHSSTYAVNLTGTITASSLSGGNTLVTTDIPFSGAPNDYVVNKSKRTDYRIEAEVFKSSDSKSLAGVILSFTPNSDNIAYIDISSIVKAYLRPQWTKPSSLNGQETETSLKIFLKYQEYYDGALVGSVTSDSATPRYCVFAGIQIPNSIGGAMTDYVPLNSAIKFLTIFESPKLWRGYPATLSFIYPDALAAFYVYRAQYNPAGALIGNVDHDLLSSAADDAVNRLDINSSFTLDSAADSLKLKLVLHGVGSELLSNPSFVTSLSPWVNEDGTPAWAWATGDKATVTLPVGGGSSGNLAQSFADKTAGWYWIEYEITPSSTSTSIVIEAYNDGALVKTLDNKTFSNAAQHTETLLVYIPTFDKIRSRVSHPSTNVTVDMFSFSLKAFLPTDYTKTLTFEVEDACANPVMLVWKNSLGGDAFWLFEHGQESGYAYSGSKKAKRMTLYAEHLTTDQWEALNELNTLGEVYKENILDFTSSTNKTHKRDGAQVYVVDTAGNKTGVIVIPTNNVINTKDATHSIEIEIEYPERIE